MNDGQTKDFIVHNHLKSLLGENSAPQQAHDQPPLLSQTEAPPHDGNSLDPAAANQLRELLVRTGIDVNSIPVASDDMAASLKAGEVQSGRDALEILYEAAILGRVDSSAITQRRLHEPHNHTSEAPDHASSNAPLWSSNGFYENSTSPPTQPGATHSVKEFPGEGTLRVDFNYRRTPENSAKSPLRRRKHNNLRPQERLMRRIGACLYCRQRRVRCELGVNGCLRCERVNRPCEHSYEITLYKQAEDARRNSELFSGVHTEADMEKLESFSDDHFERKPDLDPLSLDNLPKRGRRKRDPITDELLPLEPLAQNLSSDNASSPTQDG